MKINVCKITDENRHMLAHVQRSHAHEARVLELKEKRAPLTPEGEHMLKLHKAHIVAIDERFYDYYRGPNE